MTTALAIEDTPAPPGHWPVFAAAALFLLSLALFWPGVAMYDTVQQYQQVLSGRYYDWHPPVMARLWSLLAPVAPGTPPMLVLQLALYWTGLGALARALGGGKAVAVLALGASPLFLGWQGVVLKDPQMVGALVCATGLTAAWRLRGRAIPWPVLGLVILCLIYATLVRANAAFSTVPLIVLLFARPMKRSWAAGAILAGIAAAILLSQPLNHRLFGAAASGVDQSEATYDLAAIAVRSGDGAAAGLTSKAVAALKAGHCVKPLFWDPLFVRGDCDDALSAYDNLHARQLYRLLAGAAARHPLAYLEQRAAHLNSTLRWLVPAAWPLAEPPGENEPNKVGLASPPCCEVLSWQNSAGMMAETPLGWPVFWIVMAAWGLGVARRLPAGEPRRIATALFVSALCQEASFALLSISSDLRYHLWAMLGTALGWVLLWHGGPVRWRSNLALAALAIVLLSGFYTRLTLPSPPAEYSELVL